MSYTIVFGGVREAPLATINGWAEVKGWAEGLEGYDALQELCERGTCGDLDLLEEDIEDVLDVEEAPDTVRSTLDSLLTNVKARAEGEDTAFVSDGMGPDDDEEDEIHSDGD